MAGQKAKIDKDSNQYLSKGSQPDAERETAYNSTSSIVGTHSSDDRNGNGDDVFKGKTKKDKTRKADQTTTGTTGIGDTATGLSKESRFSHIVNKRFSLSEAENPSVATSPTTSDNPAQGMGGVSSDTESQKDDSVDIKSTLESIALQAAETFEILDENIDIPDTMKNELKEASKTVDAIFDVVSGAKQNSSTETNNTPVHSDTKIPVKESGMELYCIKAVPLLGEAFESEEMSLEEAEFHFDDMVESGAYESVKIESLSSKQKKIAKLAGDEDDIDSADLAVLRSKKSKKKFKKIAETVAKTSMFEMAMDILENHKKIL